MRRVLSTEERRAEARRPGLPSVVRRGEGGPFSVLYFSNSVVRGGAVVHILTLLHGLDRRQYRPFLVCTPEVAEQLRPDLPADVEPVALRLRRPGDLGAARCLARLLRARRIDILHSHLFFASVFASPIGWLCRV